MVGEWCLCLTLVHFHEAHNETPVFQQNSSTPIHQQILGRRNWTFISAGQRGLWEQAPRSELDFPARLGGQEAWLTKAGATCKERSPFPVSEILGRDPIYRSTVTLLLSCCKSVANTILPMVIKIFSPIQKAAFPTPQKQLPAATKTYYLQPLFNRS